VHKTSFQGLLAGLCPAPAKGGFEKPPLETRNFQTLAWSKSGKWSGHEYVVWFSLTQSNGLQRKMPAALPPNLFNAFAQAAECGQKMILLIKYETAPYSKPSWSVVRCYVLFFQLPTTWRRYIVVKLCGWCRKTRTMFSVGPSAKERERGFHVLPT
jgi:hypothetical protein